MNRPAKKIVTIWKLDNIGQFTNGKTKSVAFNGQIIDNKNKNIFFGMNQGIWIPDFNLSGINGSSTYLDSHCII
jgi:hypothetical protein